MTYNTVSIDRFMKDELPCLLEQSGDEESAELLDSISLHVDSVAFHLENDSPDHRVHYEVGLFTRFVERLLPPSP